MKSRNRQRAPMNRENCAWSKSVSMCTVETNTRPSTYLPANSTHTAPQGSKIDSSTVVEDSMTQSARYASSEYPYSHSRATTASCAQSAPVPPTAPKPPSAPPAVYQIRLPFLYIKRGYGTLQGQKLSGISHSSGGDEHKTPTPTPPASKVDIPPTTTTIYCISPLMPHSAPNNAATTEYGTG